MVLRPAQITLDAFLHEFLPEKAIPADVEMDAFIPAYFEAGAQEGPMRDNLCKIASSVFTTAARREGVMNLVAKDTHLWDMDDYGEDSEDDEDEYEGCSEEDEDEDADDYEEGEENENDEQRMIPNVTVYPETQGNKDEKAARMAYSGAYLSIEVTAGPSLPPFVVPDTLPEPEKKSSEESEESDESEEHNREEGMQSMEKISRFAMKMMQRQFLACYFTIFVCRNYAWLMRWDRAGFVISEPFDFLQQPQLLHAFFYRFACMTDVERGCDPTVKPATQDEIERMRAFTTFDTDWHRAKFQASIEEGRIMKILVPAADIITAEELEAGKKNEQTGLLPAKLPREFLVGKPHFMGNSPTGSGTKGFIAYDVTENRLVFLKDCWRPEAETYHPEGEVYLHLHSHNVDFIATPVAAGDVVDDEAGIHTTCADTLLNTPRWRHYRLILKEVAMPLEEYEDSYELVDILYCAVTAHQQAWQAEVLHRDVSAFNIMIYRYRDPVDNVWKYKGLLVDWGLCKFAHELKQPAVQKNRSGTWQFISAVLLIWPGRFRHEVWHDLESFIHVFHWCCLRFHETNFSRTDKDIIALQNFVFSQYDTHATVNGISFGGQHKLAMLQGGSVPFCLLAGTFDAALTRDDPLRAGYGLGELLTSLALLYKEHYQWLVTQFPDLVASAISKEAPGPPSQPARIKFRRLDFGERTRTAPEFQSLKPAQPVLRDHTAFLALLYEAVRIHPSYWIYHPKLPDNFAKFKYSSAAQRANASSQSSGKRPANATGNAAKRPKMDSSVHASSSTSQLVPISEGILDTAV
ncbi:hypothetical protein C8Q72DRAFT_526533 [Fomitopsis betulina]|nr:hypothetical protein C8Q72DRAFT_526533 [Fomitopsis betulina]